MEKLTMTERLLLYGLKQFNMPTEEAAAISVYLEEEEDQLQMIAYLIKHLDASHQEIMNEFGRLLKRRSKLNNEISGDT